MWREHPSLVKGAFGLTLGFSIEKLLPWLSAIVFLLTIANLSIELARKIQRNQRAKKLKQGREQKKDGP